VKRSLAVLAVLLVGTTSAVAQGTSGSTISGVVQDQTGAVLAGATVSLGDTTGHVVRSATTDGVGAFRIDAVPAGQYELRATYEGFKPAAVRVRANGRTAVTQRLVLAIADVAQEVTVGVERARVEATAAGNVDAVSVDQDLLSALPVLDQDYVAALSQFLDVGSIGTSGPTIVVNGMEVNALRMSASAVQQVKINQDPYAAEYARPGRGRIEILTKPGGQEYHAEVSGVFRDARFDARNAFATEKPAEQKHIVEGSFSGPIGSSGKTSFIVSGNDALDDQQAIVYAAGPDGPIQDNVPRPNRQSLLALSITHQVSEHTTISIRPNLEYESTENRGVGGTTLASAGANFSHNEQQIAYTQQTILRPTLLLQLQVLFGHESEPTVSVTPDRAIVVSGAFTGGGAQADLMRTEAHMQLTQSLSWTTGHHLIQAGFQLPDWSRRGFNDHTNVAGTYSFAGLTAYEGGRPYSFLQQQGNGDLAFLEKVVGTYVKDDWQARPGLSFSFGVRYDWQNYFHDSNNVVPRASVAWALGDQKTTVMRAGAGVFTDRTGPVPIADLLHSQPGGLVRYLINDPPYPNPFAGAQTSEPPSIVALAPGIQIPQTTQFGAGIDHQLTKGLTLSATYTGARGHHLFRSRDINAPPPPLYLERPDSTYGAIRQIESTGRQTTDAFQLTLRGRSGRWFSGQAQYTLSRADNDTNGVNWYPSNDYDLSGEYGRADFDRRHRLLVLGRSSIRSVVDVGVGVTMNTAGPYTITLGQDIYNNGRGKARPPGVGRNNAEAAPYETLDLRASHDFKRAANARVFTFAVDAFNVLNSITRRTWGRSDRPFSGSRCPPGPPASFSSQLASRCSAV
jgi:hypothetical protein